MKRANKTSKTYDLLVDVLDYAFVEWLVRRGVFTAFRLNFDRVSSSQGPFRDRLRDFIRLSLSINSFSPSDLVSAAFLFESTPEGVGFWMRQNAAWKRFYAELQKKH